MHGLILMNEFLSEATSVFSFIETTAEPTKTGYRWQTLDYQNHPHYHYNIFNGVGGIPIFLGAYYQATKSEAALEYANGAIRWCIEAKPQSMRFERGLQFGRLGAAYAAIFLWEITGKNSFLNFWESCVSNLLHEKPGPITDFLSGEASNGWFLLKLWQKTREDAYLKGAIRCADWICQHLRKDYLGTYCLVDPVRQAFGSSPYSGLSHGIAGVAYFFSVLFDSTQDEKWKDIAYALLSTLTRAAREDQGGLNWSPVLGKDELSRCQYSHGSPGIGLAFTMAARIFGNPEFQATAVAAGEAAYAHGDRRNNPTLCTGLAGSGELFIELFRNSENPLWLTRAEEFAKLASSYKAGTEGRDLWPTDTPGHYSADFTYGGSGTGYFFLRTFAPREYNAPLM